MALPQMDISKKGIELIPLDQIEVSDLNVRHHERDTRIPELADSIGKYGLMQPIIVRKAENSKYEIIVGQRRFLAHQELEKRGELEPAVKKAIIADESLSEMDLKILSVAENMQRVELTYEDKNRIFKEMFEHYGNVTEVSEKTGFSEATVREYLKIEELASDELKKKLNDGNISKTDAKRIIDASAGDRDKQDEITEEFVKLSPFVKGRVVEEGENNPKLSANEIFEKAKKPKVKPNLMIYLPLKTDEALVKAAGLMQMGKEDLAVEAIEQWLKDEGFFND